ncbi:hypothetical protein Bca4012_068676 [Brassica carinata]
MGEGLYQEDILLRKAVERTQNEITENLLDIDPLENRFNGVTKSRKKSFSHRRILEIAYAKRLHRTGDGDEVRSVRSAPQGPSRRSWNHQMAGFILSLLHSEPPNELALFLAKPSDPERKQLSINGVKLNQLQGHIATDDIGAWIAVSDDGVRRTT